MTILQVDLRSPPSAADVIREMRHSRRSVTQTQRKRHKCFTGMVLGATLALLDPVDQPPSRRPNPCSPRGITALHLFEYEQANELFRQARQLNPELALAYWGEAMTYHQTLWGHEDVEAGRQALARLGPTAAAGEAKSRTARDQGLLDAVERAVRRGRPLGATSAVCRSHGPAPRARPGGSGRRVVVRAGAARDDDAAVSSAPPTRTKGTARRWPGATPRSASKRFSAACCARTRSTWERSTTCIHNDDDPAHARLALEAARTLTRLAPDSSHARHMPAHIFLQLGRWPDAAAADRSAVAASDAWIARKELPPAMRNYHALPWLAVRAAAARALSRGAGDHRRARAGRQGDGQRHAPQRPVVDARALRDRNRELAAAGHGKQLRQRLRAVRHRHQRRAQPAIGMSASRVVQALGQRAQDPREGDLRPAIAIMEREVAAIIALVAGRPARRSTALRAAAAAESAAAGAARVAGADQAGAGAAR